MAAAKLLKIVQQSYEPEITIDLSETLQYTTKKIPKLLMREEKIEITKKNANSEDDDEDILPLERSLIVKLKNF